jgi:hypothetical protein
MLGRVIELMDPLCMNSFGEKSRSIQSQTAVFSVISFIDHSCEPNCKIKDHGNGMSIEAKKPLEPREEITICYVPHDMSYEQRQMRFQQFYGFKCTCPKCIREGAQEYLMTIVAFIIQNVTLSTEKLSEND